jgi:ADP-ribosylglycohydrolase
MKLSFDEYKRRMLGCWMGKNIGGVLGAPFELKRGVFDVDFYVQDLKGNPPPNDDLDLQLVWLNAVERYGRQVDAKILGEYWLSFVIPTWVEYGSGKNNLKMGLQPPLSGYVENPYRDSCGCFIRSEIWACLAPGRPELAARYAFEDAIVDHAGAGMHGEIFCAALESAAFVESDKRRLIDIGLSYIPEDSGVAIGVRAAIEAYRSGVDWKEARKRVMTAVPGTFGVQMTPLADIPADVPVGTPGYDAPSNIGLMIVGWLYGEDDFGESLCIANNCGEDTDCTCATLGSILGIIHGIDGIPEKWIEPIGDAISTCCINNLVGVIDVPKTVSALADRVLRLTPSFLGRELCDILAGPEGYTIEVLEGKELFCKEGDLFLPGINNTSKSPEPDIPELLRRSPYAVCHRFPAFTVLLDYQGDPYIKAGEARKLKLVVTDSALLGYHHQQWIDVRIVAPEGVRVLPGTECGFFLQPLYKAKTEIEFELFAETLKGPKVEVLIDISSNGRHSNGIIKALLVPRF